MAMEEEDGAQLLAALQADDALLESATTVTVEQEAQAMAATRGRAIEHGVEPKSHGEHGWAGSMRRKFERFLEKHGERLGYEASVGGYLAPLRLGILSTGSDAVTNLERMLWPLANAINRERASVSGLWKWELVGWSVCTSCPFARLVCRSL